MSIIPTILTAALLVSAAHAGVVELQCAETTPGNYQLQFTLEPGTKSVRIFASAFPDKLDGSPEIARATSSPVDVQAGAAGKRVYFHLQPDRGPSRVVSIRRLPLEGTPNFRDLGGYETADGRAVRWGMLYRSGVLSGLTSADYQYLGQLEIHVVCDFRTDAERTTAPTRWSGESPAFVLAPIGSSGSGKDASVANIAPSGGAPADAKRRMIETYATFAARAADSYREAFAELIRGKLPMLVHCTAGKDRTGVFSALLLTTLGVPRETVLRDFELTNRYLLDSPENQKKLTSVAGTSSALAGLSPEQSRVMMAADRTYLESAFRAIDEKYGSFDSYRRQALSVSDQALQDLRDRLLE